MMDVSEDRKKEVLQELRERLLMLQDDGYRTFQCNLIPTVDPARIIGVRTPALRKIAKEIRGGETEYVLFDTLPHAYFEEDQLHSFLIEQIRDPADCIDALDRFLPYIDNWATCDTLHPRCFSTPPRELCVAVERWLSDKHPYTVRYGIGMLLSYFLDEQFDERFLASVAAVESDEYYVRMMQAWYFATALAKQYDATLPYLTEHRLPVWTHNKTIQKAIESYRIPPERKAILKKLRRK